jgi:hypothetical protein
MLQQRQPRTPPGFDFTGYMEEVCRAIAADNAELAHVDLDRIAVAYAQARNRTTYGLYASLTPLRFAGGERIEVRRKRRVAIQRIMHRGREMLYVLRFYLPRFLDLDFREKLITIFHELWHISPHFNGDLRRHPGRCYAHTHSQAKYDEEMGRLADRWLADHRPDELVAPLRNNFGDLFDRHGGIWGLRVPRPRIIPAE